MIAVKKGQEPEGLKQLREEVSEKGLSPKDAFNELKNPLKKEVMECLKRDQGQLCVYCMSRIPRTDKDAGIPGETIEHFIPLDLPDGKDVGQALDYANLFAVCHGNTKAHIKGTRRINSEQSRTCDKHRGNKAFRKIDPLREDTLKTISYKLNGEIEASDPDVNYDLTVILNLNCPSSPLISERKAALDELLSDIGQIGEDGLKPYCQRLLEAFSSEINPKTPYVGILIWYLDSMINSL